MNRMLKLGASLALSLVIVAPAWAGARDDLAAFTRGLKGLEGRFTQQVFDSRGKVKETASGTVALSAPRLFRWEYTKPYPQLILADGRKVWNYEPDLEQVTVRAQGPEEQNHPLSALIDPGRLDRQFTVQEEGARDGLEWLALTPKQGEDAGFRSARLGFARGQLGVLEIVDAAGQRTVIRFDGWKRNPAFAASRFRFAPPKGVDVIGEG
ncbi:outer membrane lipoprotein chaperone LolA [Vulcaniibacterium thermophilum]|nr:outer membrane lipoprotein chaperone LolA [Vulcaniibacterium thermophilum]